LIFSAAQFMVKKFADGFATWEPGLAPGLPQLLLEPEDFPERSFPGNPEYYLKKNYPGFLGETPLTMSTTKSHGFGAPNVHASGPYHLNIVAGHGDDCHPFPAACPRVLPHD
jgi:hypothetical protein